MKKKLSIIGIICLAILIVASLTFYVYILPKTSNIKTESTPSPIGIIIKVEPTPTSIYPQTTFAPLNPIMSLNLLIYFNYQILNVTNISIFSETMTSITFNSSVNWAGNLVLNPQQTYTFSLTNAPNTDLSISVNYIINFNGVNESLYQTKVFFR